MWYSPVIMAARFILLSKTATPVGDVTRVEANFDDQGNVTLCRRLLKKGALGWEIDKVVLSAQELKIFKGNLT